MRRRYLAVVAMLTLILLCMTAPALAKTEPAGGRGPAFDLLLINGRVIDPLSGFDTVAHVGIKGGRIQAVAMADSVRGQILVSRSSSAL